jgi:hypothetical protein
LSDGWQISFQVGSPTYASPVALRILARVLYWLVVVAVSVVLLILLVSFFESRDDSQIDNTAIPVPVALSTGPPPAG